MRKLAIYSCLIAGLLSGISGLLSAADEVSSIINPEHAESLAVSNSRTATGSKFMVVTANPLASRVGYNILHKGGHAIDAMVAVQAVLGLVEPQSSGLGGGAFVVYYDSQSGKITTYDARETAPLKATEELFLDATGQPLSFYDAVVGGRSVGTPGTPMLMKNLHDKYGRLNWSELLTPAISIAENGFAVSPYMAKSIAADRQRLSRYPDTKSYFFNDDGSPLKAGQLLQNPAYADTLRLMSKSGIEPFYQGEIAHAIVDRVGNAEGNPGVLSLQDFSQYRVIERPPACAPYRGYQVCGMGPPSSGALTVGQILGIVSHFELNKPDLESWRLIGEATRLAFADRGRYMADTDYVDMPQGLINPDYLKQRSQLIMTDGVMENVSPGEPDPSQKLSTRYADDTALELPSTSHLSIIDEQGNIVSMTTTIENGFGSRLMVKGFLLNNELTDFSFQAQRDGMPVANRVEPGKRPRSSMSPTIVLKDNKPTLVIGSPGGPFIIGYVAKAIIAHLQWGMDIDKAIAMPHLFNPYGTYYIEADTEAVKLQDELELLGYPVKVQDMNSGVSAIDIQDGKLTGSADHRREGLALGE